MLRSNSSAGDGVADPMSVESTEEPLLMRDDDVRHPEEDTDDGNNIHQRSGSSPSGGVTVIRSRGHSVVIQKVRWYANVSAHVLAVLIVLVVYAWVTMLGGLSWQAGKAKQVFNWHPLCMTTAFSFMTVSSLVFQSSQRWFIPTTTTTTSSSIANISTTGSTRRGISRNRIKLLHAGGWVVAALSAWLGVWAAFRSHNDPVSGLIANWYSFHSWMGILVMMLYVAQFLVGVRAFGPPSWWCTAHPSWPFRGVLVRWHGTVVGPLIYFATGATLLLGIQEKEGFVGCSYPVDDNRTTPDVWPHPGRIPAACLVSHTLGLLIFLTMVATGLALTDF